MDEDVRVSVGHGTVPAGLYPCAICFPALTCRAFLFSAFGTWFGIARYAVPLSELLNIASGPVCSLIVTASDGQDHVGTRRLTGVVCQRRQIARSSGPKRKPTHASFCRWCTFLRDHCLRAISAPVRKDGLSVNIPSRRDTTGKQSGTSVGTVDRQRDVPKGGTRCMESLATSSRWDKPISCWPPQSSTFPSPSKNLSSRCGR